MTIAFLFDRREGYYAAQDIAPDHRYALMRQPAPAEAYDDVLPPQTTFRDRTRKWGGWGLAKPKNSKPRRKEHRL